MPPPAALTPASGLARPVQLLADIPWPAIDAATFADPTYRALIGSGLLLALALMAHFARALLALHRGQRPDFLLPILHLLLLASLLHNYRWLCQTLVSLASALGAGAFGGHDAPTLEALWEQRRAAYQAYVAQALPAAPGVALDKAGVVTAGLDLAAQLALLANCAALYAVRYGQLWGVTLLLVMGPWLLALGYVGGPFRGAGRLWGVALVELGAWTLGLQILASCLRTFDAVTSRPATLSVSQEIVRSGVNAALILAVPVFVHLALGALRHNASAWLTTPGVSVFAGGAAAPAGAAAGPAPAARTPSVAASAAWAARPGPAPFGQTGNVP